jgi:hypothetical protein
MNLTNGQKKVISNIFRDLTKLTVIALVVGQFVPGHEFNFLIFFWGLISAILMAVAAVRFAVDAKEVGI